MKPSLSPLDLGKEQRVISDSFTEAGTTETLFSIDSESVLISLFVRSVSGTLDLAVYTVGTDGEELLIINFPQVSAPSSELLIRKAASSLRKVKIRAVYSDACSFEVRARGVSSSAASVIIEGSSGFLVTQKTINTTPNLLLPLSLVDRRGILILNNNINGSEILFLSDTLSKATGGSAVYPIYPGQNITIDLQAGAEIYAVSSTGTIDVKIVEVGGG